MELTEQERELEKSTAKAWGGLLLGLAGLTLLIMDTSQLHSIIVLAALFAICTFFIIFLLLPSRWKRRGFRRKLLEQAIEAKIKPIPWLIGLGTLGISLTQMESEILK